MVVPPAVRAPGGRWQRKTGRLICVVCVIGQGLRGGRGAGLGRAHGRPRLGCSGGVQGSGGAQMEVPFSALLAHLARDLVRDRRPVSRAVFVHKLQQACVLV